MINIRGLINLDFADIRTVMMEQGMAIMGTALANGDNRSVEAAKASISSPLLENVSIQGARGVIINVTGGKDLSLYEVNEASTLITEAAHEDAEIIFGAVIDENMGNSIRVTVIATGFDQNMVKNPDNKVSLDSRNTETPNQDCVDHITVSGTETNQEATKVPVHEQVFSPPESAPTDKQKPLARDILIAKARAYKEARQAEQLSMIVEDQEVEEEEVEAPLSQNDLEVPTYLRRQMSQQDD